MCILQDYTHIWTSLYKQEPPHTSHKIDLHIYIHQAKTKKLSRPRYPNNSSFCNKEPTGTALKQCLNQRIIQLELTDFEVCFLY